MRVDILAAVSLVWLTACTQQQQRNPLKPSQPAIQITIPDTPGWSPSTNNNRIYDNFEAQLRERIKASDGAIRRMTWHQKDLSTVVTLYGEHPGQIVTLTRPFLKQARLPRGTKVMKYEGVGGEREEPVQQSSRAAIIGESALPFLPLPLSIMSSFKHRQQALLDALATRIVVLDGAMGTMIQQYDPTIDDWGGPAFENCAKEHDAMTGPPMSDHWNRHFLDSGSQ